MHVPSNFDINNLKLNLDKNIFTMSFDRLKKTDKSDIKSISHNSFLRTFTIPETKAGINDVIKKVDNNILTITIPIIK